MNAVLEHTTTRLRTGRLRRHAKAGGAAAHSATNVSSSTISYLPAAFRAGLDVVHATLWVGGDPYQPAYEVREEVESNTFQVAKREVRQALGRMEDGWDDENSMAPSECVLADFDRFMTTLSLVTTVPSFEVDGDDGRVSLAWASQAGDRVVTAVLRGTETVRWITSTFTDHMHTEGRTFAVSDDHAIASMIDADEHLRELLGVR